ncbi:MAG: uracil-DNA glycosylase [Anaerolineae bacterium]
MNTPLPDPTPWQTLNAEITACRRCPRLVAWREQVAREKRRAYRDWTYWGRPVPGFGDPRARLLIVGLAPGAHGSNRTGRMFTGDSSGDTLYAALHAAGFANQPTARHREDGLLLTDAFITAVARCAPPKNRPTPEELNNCRPFLVRELDLLPGTQVLLALGQIAFDRSLRLLRNAGVDIPRLKFGHGLHHPLNSTAPASLRHLVACYHPSRQNTQTGRLTQAMLDDVFRLARSLLVDHDLDH